MCAEETNGIGSRCPELPTKRKRFNAELRVLNSMDVRECICVQYRIYKYL